MNILVELDRAVVEGPFAALQSGDASETLTHFPGFGRLAPEAQNAVDRVWAGQLQECLLLAQDGRDLFLVQHCPTGQPRSGVRYGYVVRTLPLTSGTVQPRSAAGQPLARGMQLLVRIASACACLWIWNLAANPLATHSDRQPDAMLPHGRSDDHRRRLLDVERREKHIAEREIEIEKAAASQALFNDLQNDLAVLLGRYRAIQSPPRSRGESNE